jgi:ABC-type transport system substrate-binding protein
MATSRWLSLGLLTLALLSTGYLSAQPPRKEEEEETKGKARPAVPVPVVEPDTKAAPPALEGVDPDVGTMREEERKAKNAAAREMYRSLAIPYDRLTSTFKGGPPPYRIELWPTRELPEEEIDVRILRPNLLESYPQKLATGSGFIFTPFELIVLESVEAFLKRDPKDLGLTRDRQMEYASRAVSAGLRWHLEMVEKGKRVGKKWDEVKSLLRGKIIAIQRERFSAFVEAKEYERAEEIGIALLNRFPKYPDVLNDVYWLQLFRTERSAKATDADLRKLREALLAYEQQPGRKDEALVTTSRRRLRNHAVKLMNDAKLFDQQKKTADALNALRQAEAIDPEVPGLEAARLKYRGKVLYVGVPKLPSKMSPAAAEHDAERWAVELMFEGLLQAVPDPDLVVRYRPVLAEALPQVMPLGRAFTLPRTIRWATEGGDVVDARDVRETLNLLRAPAMRHRWPADGLEVFEVIDRLTDNFRLRLAYQQGVLEPLGRATFKVIPARYLMEQGKAADDPAFAANPYGTGPFRYEGREKEPGDREVAVFRANPQYGQRPGKFGLPWVREIRMFVPNASRLAGEVTGGQLHFYPDAPSDLAPRFRDEPGLKENMRIHVAKTNRRIHMLAVNHRRSHLQNDKLRQGLSAAINREAILKDVYRGGSEGSEHTALTGPFPVTSWATPSAARQAPLYKPGAGGLILEGLAGVQIRLGLIYSTEDPKAAAVCQKIKAQIEEASADKNGRPSVTIDPQGLPAQQFRELLTMSHSYDLALTTFDYRDDLYSLAGLLDPEAAGRDGRNFLGYMAPGTNPVGADHRLRAVVDEVRRHRDFKKEVRDKTWDIHHLVNQRVPFIPLWQLDRFMVVHKDLELFFDNPDVPVSPDALDPAVVFTGIEMWRLK